MLSQVFNDADQFLIARWAEARNLADAMKKLRDKYRAVMRRIGEEARERHKGIDVFREYFTHAWTSGNLVFGCRRWAGADGEYPDGLWLSNLNLVNGFWPETYRSFPSALAGRLRFLPNLFRR